MREHVRCHKCGEYFDAECFTEKCPLCHPKPEINREFYAIECAFKQPTNKDQFLGRISFMAEQSKDLMTKEFLRTAYNYVNDSLEEKGESYCNGRYTL